jgi:hypothetical protein
VSDESETFLGRLRKRRAAGSSNLSGKVKKFFAGSYWWGIVLTLRG